MLSFRGGGIRGVSSFGSSGTAFASRKESIGTASNGGMPKEPSSRLRLLIERAELLRETELERGTLSHTDSFGSVAESFRNIRLPPSFSSRRPYTDGAGVRESKAIALENTLRASSIPETGESSASEAHA